MTSHPALLETAHQPWPLPASNWSMRQEWNELTFLHWEISPSVLRSLLPPGVEVDEFGGTGWIGVVPFTMKGVTLRGLPAPAFLSDFPEINVRTYVRVGGKPGVWFFSLAAPHRLAVWAARTFYHLPYHYGSMTVGAEESVVRYQHRRGDFEFEADCAPHETVAAPDGSFEAWATERYCLYTTDRRGRLYRGEVHHPRWPLRRGTMEIRRNNLLSPWTVGPMHPSVLFSRRLPVVLWGLERI